MDYDFSILYYIEIYKKWWKKMALVMAISISLTACFSFFQPITYVSTVTLFSADSVREAAGVAWEKFLWLSEQSGGFSNDMIISILQSRRMLKDIAEVFKLDKKSEFRYRIATRQITAGMAIDVKGNDPQLTKEIANFTVQNLDRINTELNITPAKSMAKVLDPAAYGSPESRQGLRKVIVAGLFSFLLVSLYAFFLDYLRKLKSQ